MLVAPGTGTAQGYEWQTRAACRGFNPETWFPDYGTGTPIAAKRICRHCEVKDACLESALCHDEAFGIWGGMTPRERNKIKIRNAS